MGTFRRVAFDLCEEGPHLARDRLDLDDTTIRMSRSYAKATYRDASATLDDLRESVMTLEDSKRTAQRVFGCTHPLTTELEGNLQDARAALRARETPSA